MAASEIKIMRHRSCLCFHATPICHHWFHHCFYSYFSSLLVLLLVLKSMTTDWWSVLYWKKVIKASTELRKGKALSSLALSLTLPVSKSIDQVPCGSYLVSAAASVPEALVEQVSLASWHQLQEAALAQRALHRYARDCATALAVHILRKIIITSSR